MIEVIGVPFDLCGKRFGSRLGPDAVRLGGLIQALEGQRVEVREGGDVEVSLAETGASGIRNFESAFQMLGALKSAVKKALEDDHMPLVVGGDHSLSIGSVSGALETYRGDLAVLWIDAHSDLNSPATSPSGNLHGMPLAALSGVPCGKEGAAMVQWGRLLSEIVPKERFDLRRAGWFGLRELDPGERARIAELQGEFTATMHDIDRQGTVACVERFDRWMRDTGATALWISFDVDVLDPILAPGTGTAVHGGLTYREMHLVAELLHEFLSAGDCPYRLVGLDLVEVNPLFDSNNETARTAVEWIASLFGRTILGKR